MPFSHPTNLCVQFYRYCGGRLRRTLWLWYQCLLLILLTGTSTIVTAVQPIVLNADPNNVSFVLTQSEYLPDPRNVYSATQLFAGGEYPFVAPPQNTMRFAKPEGTYWFRFSLHNSSHHSSQSNSDSFQRFWLEMDNLRLEKIDLYKKGNEAKPQRTGATFVNPDWHRQERLNALPIDLRPGEIAEYLLRVESSSPVRFAPRLLSDHGYQLSLGTINGWIGVFYGILFTLFVFTLNIYFSLRDKIFIYFLIYVAAVTLQTASSQGTIKIFFPGDNQLVDLATIIGSLANLLAGAFFTRYFLQLPGNYPLLDKIMLASGIVPMVIATAVPMSMADFERLLIIAGTLSLFINISTSAYRLAKGYTPAVFILAANLLLFIPIAVLRLLPEQYFSFFAAANILNFFAVLKALILGCGMSALIDRLNKSLNSEVAERKSRELQLMHAQQIAHYGDWHWDTDHNEFVFSHSALDILPALTPGNENDFEKLLKCATTKERRRIREAFENAAKEKQGLDTEFSLLHDNGSTRYYLTRAEFQRDDHGQLTPILIGTIHDITDRKLADLANRENEQRWRELADSTFEAILIYQEGIIVDANQACDQLLGYSPTQLIGTSGEVFVHREQLQSLLSAIADATDKPIELMLRTASDEDIAVEVRSRAGTFNQQPVQIVAIRDVSERKQHEQQLRQLGYYDSLTGLANRALFQERLQHAIDKSRRYEQKHALLFIDLDQFKHVNDSLGHDIGDQLLIEVGQRLKTRVRKEDTVARLGGDEFAVLVEDISAPYVAAKVAEEILAIMSEQVAVDEFQLVVTPSIGIAIYPSDGISGTELLRKADTAMYHAKSLGRNNYQFYTEALNEKMIRRMDLESELRLAINRQEFTLNFQPKVDLDTGDIVGAEALLRWRSDKFGFVPPDEFIPIAEETGLIWPIGEWVLEHACRQALAWCRLYPDFGSIAVNISGNQFNHGNLVETVAEILERTGLAPRLLELEITEGAIINNAEEAIKTMRKLKELGVRLSLDDFGTGYSSLNYLKRFPVDSLKIDRSFVAEIVHDKIGQLIADNIVKLAHDLRLNVVAEGIETIEQLNLIRGMGCDQLQGYIFSKPLPGGDMELLLANASNLYKNQAANL